MLDKALQAGADSANRPLENMHRRSRLGLNGANFFLAEVTAVVLPFVNDFLHDKGWHYDMVGMATAVGGLGVLLAQTPAGILVDRSTRPRSWLAATSLALGVCYVALLLIPTSLAWVFGWLFIAGVTQALLLPLLGALALALAGHVGISRMMGTNQIYNHLGNIASAALAVVLVHWKGVQTVFLATLGASACAAACCFLIRPDTLQLTHQRNVVPEHGWKRWLQVPRDRRIPILLVSIALFHLANAPVMPLVALYVGHLGGSKSQIAQVVLIAQIVMVPTAWLAGRLADRWGRKPVMAIGFVVLPVRILLYATVSRPEWLLAIQALDGVGAGIYGVVVVSMCADICGAKAGFNTLVGMTATALALGGVLGPLAAGMIVEHLGFTRAFVVLAAVAAAGALLFILKIPETRVVAVKE